MASHAIRSPATGPRCCQLAAKHRRSRPNPPATPANGPTPPWAAEHYRCAAGRVNAAKPQHPERWGNQRPSPELHASDLSEVIEFIWEIIMPAEMIGAGENVAGGIRTARRPMYHAAGGPNEITQQQDIGASSGGASANPRTEWISSADPRCECISPIDPRTEVR